MKMKLPREEAAGVPRPQGHLNLLRRSHLRDPLLAKAGSVLVFSPTRTCETQTSENVAREYPHRTGTCHPVPTVMPEVNTIEKTSNSLTDVLILLRVCPSDKLAT